MYHKTVMLEQISAGNSGVDPFVQGLPFLLFIVMNDLRSGSSPAIVLSCLDITALLASAVSAYICHILDRRRMSVRVGAIIYLIIQNFVPDLIMLIVGRSIRGWGTDAVTIFQCEIAPRYSRDLVFSWTLCLYRISLYVVRLPFFLQYLLQYSGGTICCIHCTHTRCLDFVSFRKLLAE